jgi:hypothetical protein
MRHRRNPATRDKTRPVAMSAQQKSDVRKVRMAGNGLPRRIALLSGGNILSICRVYAAIAPYGFVFCVRGVERERPTDAV